MTAIRRAPARRRSPATTGSAIRAARTDTRPPLDRADAGALLELPVLARAFFLRPTLQVARALLGKILVHRHDAGTTAGRIVEVEAYRGPDDRAAHTAGGRRTPRNEVMWGPAGHLYVYFTYGRHHCCNVVTRAAGEPEAVLIRALEPLAGIASMRVRRALPGGAEVRLCRGPGNVCRAMGIDRAQNGADLTVGPVVILDAPSVSARAIACSPRIGVAYAGPDAALPWRFYARDSSAVSRSPRAPARRITRGRDAGVRPSR